MGKPWVSPWQWSNSEDHPLQSVQLSRFWGRQQQKRYQGHECCMLLQKSSWTSHEELHIDLLDKLYNPLCQLHTTRQLKPNPANRNIPKKDTWETESYRNSCYCLFAVQLTDANQEILGCHKDLGPPKIPPTCLMRLVTFNELSTLKPLKYKNFGSSICIKRSCLECIPNN